MAPSSSDAVLASFPVAKSNLELHHHLAKVLLLPLVLVRVKSVVESKRLFVHHRVNVVGFDGLVHVLELRLGADQDAPDDAARAQGREGARLVRRFDASQESDHRDHPFEFDS